MHVVSCVTRICAALACSHLLALCSGTPSPSLHPKVVSKEDSLSGIENNQSSPAPELVPSIEAFDAITFDSVVPERDPDTVYQFGPTIGKGKFGVVFSGARLCNAEERVAIKRIHGKGYGQISKEAKMEACILKYCSGANHVLQMVDACQAFGSVWLATEWAPFGDLEAYTFQTRESARRQLNLKVLPTLLFQLLTALKFLHARHMVHRDVKPANVLIFPPFKLGDFGLCTPPSPSDKSIEGNYGSPLYTAPEVYRNKRVDAKADIWALGVTVLSVLCDPFPGWLDMNERLFSTKLISCQGPWQTDATEKTPPELEKVVNIVLSEMLQFDPSARPSAAELLEHLDLSVHCPTRK